MGLFLGTQERVRNSRGKRAISFRATEVLLYFVQNQTDLITSRVLCVNLHSWSLCYLFYGNFSFHSDKWYLSNKLYYINLEMKIWHIFIYMSRFLYTKPTLSQKLGPCERRLNLIISGEHFRTETLVRIVVVIGVGS